jgi:hypothetical protein
MVRGVGDGVDDYGVNELPSICCGGRSFHDSAGGVTCFKAGGLASRRGSVILLLNYDFFSGGEVWVVGKGLREAHGGGKQNDYGHSEGANYRQHKISLTNTGDELKRML